MPIKTFVILQFIYMTAAYMGVTLLLPAVVFRRILRGRSIWEQLLMCFTVGNFYIINIVFALQLLHISRQWTLIAATLLPAVFIWARVEHISLLANSKELFKNIKRVMRGRLGMHSALRRISDNIWRYIKKLIHCIGKMILTKPIQCIFLCAVFAALYWVYGRQLLIAYGYRASDIPVHLRWANQMSRDNIFCDGVYPFGFHCMVYYLHTVFKIDTYVILCQFFFVQVVMIHLILLAFLKLCCRTRFVPYMGVLVYILGNFWAGNTYSRYFASLPQEFGMIFVIPSLYFLLVFFKTSKEDLANKKTKLNLGFFAMAFSLTLAIHFYGTMIAGLGCVGIAIGFGFRFLRKDYFKRIMLTGVLSVFIAALPMVIAFIGGTPLQGSLGWGMSVINGTSNKTTAETTEQTTAETTVQNTQESTGETAANSTADESVQVNENAEQASGTAEQSSGGDQLSGTEAETTEEKKPSIGEKIKSFPQIAKQQIGSYIINQNFPNANKYILISIAAVILLGIIFCMLRRINDGGQLISAGMVMVMLTILLCAGALGLPPLMDASRCSIYYAYLLPMVPVLLIDGILALIQLRLWLTVLTQMVSLAVSAAVVFGVFHYDLIKEPKYVSDFVTNGAFTCLTNIIHDNEDETWTIVSANDETQMGLDHGWHYETISFMRQMEYLTKKSTIYIPTKTVYFFIEKRPLNYTVPYDGSGQNISQKGAENPLPNVGGIGMYQGENRWILMSRMYYWAQAFKAKYPNEMEVYYEDDQFICYKIEQNMYHLYDFAIDYGYNQVMDEGMEK